MENKHTQSPDVSFDGGDLACGELLLRLVAHLKGLAHGTVVRVVATDPGSVCDMAAFAEQTGHVLLQTGEEGGKYVFFLKKA